MLNENSLMNDLNKRDLCNYDDYSKNEVEQDGELKNSLDDVALSPQENSEEGCKKATDFF